MAFTTVPMTPGSGVEVAVDRIDGDDFQRIKIDVGEEGVVHPVSHTNPFPVQIVTAASGGEALPVLFAVVDESTSAEHVIVAALVGKIRVVSAKIVVGGAVNVQWRSDTTPLEGATPLTEGGGYILPYNPEGWFETAAAEDLRLNVSAAEQVSGHISYVEAP